MSPSTAFLPSPHFIRRALAAGLAEARSLDAAVAFVGRDWPDVLGTFRGKTRVVCWLTSTNTNPFAVEQMLSRGIAVRRLDAMHAKVYLCAGSAGPTAIVGSANLSAAALAEHDAFGQHEAAVLLKNVPACREIKTWFAGLWTSAKPVRPADIKAAKRAWLAARSRESAGSGVGTRRSSAGRATPCLPAAWTPPRELVRLARSVRALNPATAHPESREAIHALAKTGSKSALRTVIGALAAWTGHPGAYYPSLDESPARRRAAFAMLLNQGEPLADRLAQLGPRGKMKLDGFGLPSLTILLSWCFPTEYPPFDRRTIRLLKDFDIAPGLPRSVSPQQYADWISLAQDLATRLGLPTTGHVDRLVWSHTQEMAL